MFKVVDLLENIKVELDLVVTYLPKDNPFVESLSYLISTGGKRLRPLLFSAIQLDLNPAVPIDIDLCLAWEFLHLASLLHDDLPALDNDDTRRGQPTVHVRFSEHEALLLGDWLVSLAMRKVLSSQVHDSQKLLCIDSMSKLWCSVCEGQELDIRRNLLQNDCSVVNYLKTAAFFETVTTSAAQIACMDEQLIYLISRWGCEFGLLFQELDDLVDGQTNQQFSSDALQKYRVLKEELIDSLISMHDSGFQRTIEVINLAFIVLR